MEVILIKCAKCGIQYLTQWKSGETECPECKHVNVMLVGEDAEKAMRKQEREKRMKK